MRKLFTVVSTLAIIVAVAEFVMLTHPTKLPPLFEQGHRGYWVKTGSERQALLETLALGGLKPDMRFKIGPTDQTLMSDGYTVVNLMDSPGNFISLISEDPERGSLKALDILRRVDSTARRDRIPIPEKEGKYLYPISCEKLGVTIVFRPHAMKLGGKPKTIPL